MVLQFVTLGKNFEGSTQNLRQTVCNAKKKRKEKENLNYAKKLKETLFVENLGRYYLFMLQLL